MAVRDWVRGLRGTLDRQTVYLKLENDDASAESVATLLDSTQSIKPHRAKYVFSIANALLFLSSIVLVVVAYTRPVTDSQCVRQLYTWSPAFEAIDYHEEDYSGLFRQASDYRGKPTPELDERWMKLWDYREFDVPESAWPLMNRTADGSIVRTPKGGGAALLWGMHQLHCLDWLRMWSYKEYYMARDGAMPEHFQGLSDNLVRTHLDHCIDVLRQDMMCHVDVTPYFIVYDETAPVGETFDFSPHQKCRDFDKIRQWNVDNLAVD